MTVSPAGRATISRCAARRCRSGFNDINGRAGLARLHRGATARRRRRDIDADLRAHLHEAARPERVVLVRERRP
jgi:hypothetical protein